MMRATVETSDIHVNAVPLELDAARDDVLLVVKVQRQHEVGHEDAQPRVGLPLNGAKRRELLPVLLNGDTETQERK